MPTIETEKTMPEEKSKKSRNIILKANGTPCNQQNSHEVLDNNLVMQRLNEEARA